ncbi:gag-pol polyprotein [Tanacetum coccineum]
MDFLNGPLKGEVYVTQPDGLVDLDHPKKVYRLRKALYGLKQALRAWTGQDPTNPHERTINMRLLYPKDSGFELTAFSDADHARKSCLLYFRKKPLNGGISIPSQDSRIKKAQELKTKTSANSDIKDPSSETKLRGRLLESFQEDAKYEHVGQDTRSQDDKDDQDIQGKRFKKTLNLRAEKSKETNDTGLKINDHTA